MKNLTKSEKKFQRVMHEFGQGELKSHGQPVTDQKQAVAIAFSEARKIDPDYGMMNNGGGISEEQAAALAQIYKTGTAKQLWAAWSTDNRIHFLMDHATEYFELMDEDFYKSSNGFASLSYDALPSAIRKSVVIHHAQGMYGNGGEINSNISAKYNIGRWGNIGHFIHNESGVRLNVFNDKKTDIENWNDAVEWAKKHYDIIKSKNLSPAKKKLLDRINTLKATKANAGEAAQKAIQKKIDVLQRQFDYNPSAKEKAMANKGKFALDVPASYSKAMYKKLWAMKVFPQIYKLNGTHSIVVNSKANLNKAYEVFSDILKEKKEKVPSLASISRKL